MTFLGPEKFVRFEKHQKAFSGALRGAFRAREVLGSFDKRTPGVKIHVHCTRITGRGSVGERSKVDVAICKANLNP